jgi:glycosyltransferase involved in cell wall biosynthesis
MKAPFLSSLAAVLPRYGEHLGGGAEGLTKGLVEHLHGDYIPRIEVWTTCALDHRTWENSLPSGVTVEGGITVRRFPVDERDLERFIHAELAMQQGARLTVDEQLDWLGASVNSQALYRHILEHGAEIEALLFTPYLFATSFWGSLIYPERSLLIPCLHNEHYAYQDVFRVQFSRLRGLVFNSEPEAQLAAELYRLPNLKERSAVVGMGFDENSPVRSSAPHKRPYLLYCGRKEKGKNLDLLVQYFCELDEPELELVVCGQGEIDFELPPRVVELPFTTEEEKRSLMRGAVALCQPSVNESFSIVMMEAWLEGTPCLVHGQCAVTRHHVVRSGGGLYFTNASEFCAVVRFLRAEQGLRAKLGTAGRNYVLSEYSWPQVVERFGRALRRFGFGEGSEEVAKEAIC